MGNNPLALVLMNWNEDTITNGPLHERMRQYIDNEVGECFRISFPDFINQPTYVVVMMLEEAKRRMEKRSPESVQVEKALAALTGKSK